MSPRKDGGPFSLGGVAFFGLEVVYLSAITISYRSTFKCLFYGCSDVRTYLNLELVLVLLLSLGVSYIIFD